VSCLQLHAVMARWNVMCASTCTVAEADLIGPPTLYMCAMIVRLCGDKPCNRVVASVGFLQQWNVCVLVHFKALNPFFGHDRVGG